MENPFKYGVEVSGGDFVNRERELTELRRELSSGKSIILYSPRRIGKTSLVLELFRRLGRKIVPVYVKLYGIETEEAFARQILEKTSAAYPKFDRMLKSVQSFFYALRPNFTITPDGEIKVEISRKITPQGLEEALDFPEKAAEELGRRAIVAFDEFQEIRLYDGMGIEKLMKAKFEHHKRASYIFAGSKRHLLLEMFSSEDRPLFKFAKPIELGNLSASDFKPFIAGKFRATNGSIQESVADKILNYTNGNPYFTQQLCHELWNLTKNVEGIKEVIQAVESIINHHSAEFEHIWGMIKSKDQKNLLLGMSAEPNANIFSTAFIGKYGLKTASNVKKAYGALEGKGLIEKGVIVELFFVEWIRRLSGLSSLLSAEG